VERRKDRTQKGEDHSVTDKEVKIVALLLIIAVVGAVAYYLMQPQQILYQWGEQLTGHAETPFGESIDINLDVGGETSGTTSWLTSYQDSTSQNVYTVDGTYASQELVTLAYSASVTYANVENIKITVKIKAIDQSDQSSYEYILANAKPLSGASPISDSDSVQKSITQHLTDCEASTSDATINYDVYAQVTATGTISGQSLTATIPYTNFASKHYVQSSESASAEVTPQVSVASWTELMQTPEMLAIVALVALIVIIAVVPKKEQESKKSSRKKKSSKASKGKKKA